MTRKQNPNIEQKGSQGTSAKVGQKPQRESADKDTSIQAQQRQDEDSPNRQRPNTAGSRGPGQGGGYAEQSGSGRHSSARSSDSDPRKNPSDAKPAVRSPNARDEER
jgi:hypothetical protein